MPHLGTNHDHDQPSKNITGKQSYKTEKVPQPPLQTKPIKQYYLTAGSLRDILELHKRKIKCGALLHVNNNLMRYTREGQFSSCQMICT